MTIVAHSTNQKPGNISRIPLPAPMLQRGPFTPAALRLYAELHHRGADTGWVRASITELAVAIGYSHAQTYRAARMLAPRLVRMQRFSPHGKPVFRFPDAA